jgi:hypothetical protein
LGGLAVLRTFWEFVKEAIFDAAGDQFRTQEEIDDFVDAAFSTYAIVTDNPDEIPGSFRRRNHTFFDPLDLIEWIDQGAIPPNYVAVYINKIDGLTWRYIVYVEDGS